MRKLAILILAIGCGRDIPVPPQHVSPQQPLPHSIRVVAVGDSLAYGTGDESGRGIAGRLRDALRQDGVAAADTVNLGVAGAGTSDLHASLRKERVRREIAKADAVVLSIGANDLFATPHARQQTLHDPLRVANAILDRIQQIVSDIHAINPGARVLILGGYNPVPKHEYATLINYYLRVWDRELADRFGDDRRVSVVKISDLVGPQQLSRLDNFHPGGAAYEEISKRIAAMLLT